MIRTRRPRHRLDLPDYPRRRALVAKLTGLYRLSAFSEHDAFVYIRNAVGPWSYCPSAADVREFLRGDHGALSSDFA